MEPRVDWACQVQSNGNRRFHFTNEILLLGRSHAKCQRVTVVASDQIEDVSIQASRFTNLEKAREHDDRSWIEGSFLQAPRSRNIKVSRLSGGCSEVQSLPSGPIVGGPGDVLTAGTRASVRQLFLIGTWRSKLHTN